MKNSLNEQEQVYSEAHSKELLALQSWYNNEIKLLNDTLAKKKSDLMVKYMKIAQQSAAQTATRKTAAKTAETAPPPTTGTVTTAGQPVSSTGNPKAPTVESYPDILKIKAIDNTESISEDFIDKYSHIPMEKRNWYQKPEAQPGYAEWKEEEEKKSKKRLTPKQKQHLQDIKYEMQDIQAEIQQLTSKFDYLDGEIEQFFAEIGEKASDILNSGAYKNDEEKSYALLAAGVKNPEQVIQNYNYYYPKSDKNLDKDKMRVEKEVDKLRKKFDKLQKERNKLEELNETLYNVNNADKYEIQNLKDYLDAENISYSEDEEGETIDFDDTELDAEWQDNLESMGLTYEKDFEEDETETDDILSMEDEEDEEIDIADVDEKIDEEKVFYVKIEDEGEAFIGKIYKLFDEGDWRSKIIDGESETFDKLNYDPDWDEVDIIAFLRENYADAEIVSEDEFNDHVEEPEVEPEEKSEVEESIHSIPTLDDFLNENK